MKVVRDMTGTVTKTETLPIKDSSDVVFVRQRVRVWATNLKLSLVDQTKIVTAASELGRNTLEHGGGGELEIAETVDGGRKGIRLTFSDKGPGIADVKLALADGYTTKQGMGLGLGGSKRLMNEFDIKTAPGEGTIVTVTRWK
jgi:serine/threonine-protein kinase RsbT